MAVIIMGRLVFDRKDLCLEATYIIILGKGAALRTGFDAARGDVVVVQDADLEYDPSDYVKLLQPLRVQHHQLHAHRRLRHRQRLLADLDGLRREVDASGTLDAMDVLSQRAANLLTSPAVRDAFDPRNTIS